MAFLENLVNSFRYAGRGLRLASHDRNMRIMLLAALVVVSLAISYDVSQASWAVLMLCVGGVLSAEALNTAIERLADQVERRYQHEIRDIKDLAAGAVLVTAGIAATVGTITL
jgi:diacylglycerol kinase